MSRSISTSARADQNGTEQPTTTQPLVAVASDSVAIDGQTDPLTFGEWQTVTDCVLDTLRRCAGDVDE